MYIYCFCKCLFNLFNILLLYVSFYYHIKYFFFWYSLENYNYTYTVFSDFIVYSWLIWLNINRLKPNLWRLLKANVNISPLSTITQSKTLHIVTTRKLTSYWIIRDFHVFSHATGVKNLSPTILTLFRPNTNGWRVHRTRLIDDSIPPVYIGNRLPRRKIFYAYSIILNCISTSFSPDSI